MLTRTRKQLARNAPVRWTIARRKAFLAELGATANVRAASRAAGVPDGSAYRLRDKDDKFRADWAAALAEGYARVEMMLLERALNGTVKPVWHAGKKVGSIREYSDRLALGILTAHRGAVKGGAPALIETKNDITGRLCEKLVQMGERMRGASGAPAGGEANSEGGGTTDHDMVDGATPGGDAEG